MLLEGSLSCCLELGLGILGREVHGVGGVKCFCLGELLLGLFLGVGVLLGLENEVLPRKGVGDFRFHLRDYVLADELVEGAAAKLEAVKWKT